MQISEYVEKFLIANPESPIGSPSGRTNVHKNLLSGIGQKVFATGSLQINRISWRRGGLSRRKKRAMRDIASPLTKLHAGAQIALRHSVWNDGLLQPRLSDIRVYRPTAVRAARSLPTPK